jgi:TolB-like protein
MVHNLTRTILFSAAVTCCTVFGLSQTPPAPTDRGGRETLAVLPFTLHGLTPDEGTNLTRLFTQVMSESGRFEIIRSDSVKGVEGTSSALFLAEAGKAIGVMKVIQVDVVRRERLTSLRIRLVNTGDATLLYSERVDYDGSPDSLASTIIPEQARKLSQAHLDAPTPWGKAALMFGASLTFIIWILYHLRSKGRPAAGDVSSSA